MNLNFHTDKKNGNRWFYRSVDKSDDCNVLRSVELKTVNFYVVILIFIDQSTLTSCLNLLSLRTFYSMTVFRDENVMVINMVILHWPYLCLFLLQSNTIITLKELICTSIKIMLSK